MKETRGRDIRKCVGKPAKEAAWHVSSLDPDSRSAEKFAEIVRTHWCVEACHGKRDNGCHEDVFTRRCDVNVMSAMMVVGAADRTGLRAGSPLPGHQAGRVAKFLSEVQHWNRIEAHGQMKTP